VAAEVEEEADNEVEVEEKAVRMERQQEVEEEGGEEKFFLGILLLFWE